MDVAHTVFGDSYFDLTLLLFYSSDEENNYMKDVDFDLIYAVTLFLLRIK